MFQSMASRVVSLVVAPCAQLRAPAIRQMVPGARIGSVRLQRRHRAFATTTLPSTMRAVFAQEGKPVIRQIPLPKLAPGEILVKMEAAGVNRADLVQVAGNYAPPKGATEVLGLEVVGRVVSVGDGVSRFALGDRVMSVLYGGGYADFCAVPAACAMPCPDTWRAVETPSSAELCAIPETWSTAYKLLNLVGHVSAGEVVVLHAGASGVGIAAAQLCRHLFNAIPIVTCSAGKTDMAREAGAAAAIDRASNDGLWAAAVVEAANEARQSQGLPRKAGVEVILDPVAGRYAEQNCKALSQDGRWVVYGLMGGTKATNPLFGTILTKRLQVIGTTLRSRSLDYQAALAEKVVAEVLPLHVAGIVRAPLFKEMPLDEVAGALSILEQNANLGKVVLVP